MTPKLDGGLSLRCISRKNRKNSTPHQKQTGADIEDGLPADKLCSQRAEEDSCGLTHRAETINTEGASLAVGRGPT